MNKERITEEQVDPMTQKIKIPKYMAEDIGICEHLYKIKCPNCGGEFIASQSGFRWCPVTNCNWKNYEVIGDE